jgi:predicted regulator of Ras-like GTPase activity (Roadblock/LC7/MglB family)
MGTLPQLTTEDIQELEAAMQHYLTKTGATCVLLIDVGGFLITQHCAPNHFDLTTIAALASGAYMANQTIANLVEEPKFNSVYQQGEVHSLLVVAVDEYCLLTIIFKADIGIGLVKYFIPATLRLISRQLQIAQERAPGEGLDLSLLNLADPSEIFKRKPPS